MPPNSIKGALYNPEVYIRHTYQQSSQRPDRGKGGQNGSLFGLSLGVAIGTAATESSDGYPDFVATIYGPSLVDVSVPKLGTPLFIAVMDGHFKG
jgi:hypothetical protein